ncbi:AAA family ATPase [Rothia sp. 88186D007BW]
MRIHRLELTAYGPFPGTITLNFDDLNREGIFLLNGPTGSGKSTILDAICYALYGTTSSGRTDLKSRFAQPQTQPRVVLDCTIGTNRYRIDRSPAYDRPKKRGHGTLTEPAKTLIEKFDTATGTWEPDPAITRHKDAGDFMLSVLGLNAQQFNQVMLLPQGKFQRFLTASSGEREQLLKQLFGTEEFEKVQALLHEKAKDATAAADAAQQELQVLQQRAERAEHAACIDQARQALGQAPTEETPNTPTPQDTTDKGTPENTRDLTDLPHHLEHLLRELHTLTENLEEEREKSAQNLEALATEHRAATQLHKDWATYLNLTKEQENLAHKEPQIAASRTRLQEHRVAADILPRVQAAEQASTAYHQAQGRAETQLNSTQVLLISAQEKLTETALEHSLLTRAHSLLKQALKETDSQQLGEEMSAHIEGLTRYQQVEKDMAALARQEQASATVLANLTDRRTHLTQDLETAQKNLTQLRKDYAQTEEAPAQEEAARTRLTQARDKVTSAQQLITARASLATARQKSQAAEENRRAASAQAENLQRQRFDAAAQILAENLTDGQPCSVCGSTTHPAPASYDQNTPPVTQEALAQAKDQRDQAEAAAQEALAALSAAQSTLDQLVKQGTPEPEEAHTALAAAQESLSQAQAQVAHRKALARRITTAEQALDASRNELAEAERQHTSEEAKIQQLSSQRENLKAELEPHQQGPSLADRIATLNQLARQIPALGAAQAEQERHRQAQVQAQEELDRALEEAQLTDAQQVKAQLLSKAQVSQLEEQVTAHRDRTLAVTAQLESPTLAHIAQLQAAGKQPPAPEEVAQLKAHITQLRAHNEELIRHTTRLTGASTELGEVLNLLEAALAQSRLLLEDAHLKGELAATATAAPGSDNRLRMTLTTYVLAYQLTEVADAASEHLEKMTHGRYRLEHTDRAEGRGKKSGLALDIFDAWHNARRSPETLSGGETFMASLALALGLADVVQQANGGIDIDTLFVDEGFGSLDDQALEEVMTTIDSLRERGRVIGLISHVAEMKNRISKHIVLTSSPQGSSLVTEAGVA